MKKSKTKASRRRNMLGRLLLMMLIICLATAGVFAYDDGDRLRFTHTTDSGGVDIFNVDGNVGFCCEPGVKTDSSGSMTVEHVNKNSKLAKSFYYCYTHNGNWFSKVDSTSSSPIGPYWRLAIEMIAQYAVNGQDAVDYWEEEWGGSTAEYAPNIVNFVDNTCANVQVPNSFRVFIGKQDGQNAAVFYIAPPGYIALQKSADRQPQNNQGATLAGAVYHVFTDAACTTRAKDADGNNFVLTTDANGATNVVQIEEGTYYAKEITASPGFGLDTTVRQVTVSSNNTQTNPAKFTSTEPLKAGFVKVKKVSGNTDITG